MKHQFPSPFSNLFSRRVTPGHEEAYEKWLGGVSKIVAQFPGNQGSTILKPSANRAEYISIVQFDSTENLKRWMTSEERKEWIAKLDPETLSSKNISSLTGMERWFTLPDRSVSQAHPKYKMALLLLLGLFPLLLILNPLLNLIATDWHPALATLLTICFTIPIMVRIVTPQLTRLFFKWLYPGIL